MPGQRFYKDHFEITTVLEQHYGQISQEFSEVAGQEIYLEWPETQLYNHGWNVFGLRFQRRDIELAHQYSPTLSYIIQQYDKLIATAGFSTMAAGTVIHPHAGYTSALLRCHMGIRIPDGDCCLKVDGETIHWQEGRSFIFDDTFIHEAWNNTAESRTILLLDLDKAILLNSKE